MLSWDQRSPIRGTPQPKFRPLNDQARPSLSVDTSVTRHHGHTPRQVFPSKPKTQELSYISFADIKALKKGGLGGLKQQLEAKLPTRLGAQRSTSDSRMDPQTRGKDKVRPSPARSQTASFISGSASSEGKQVLPRPRALPQRIKGLRPSPLDLTHEISPSDRAITIGLALPSDGKAQCLSRPKKDEHPLRRVEDVQTPTIVITPAKQDFEIATPPEDLQSGHGFRPASSVYSHYTSYAPGRTHNGVTPPVPPLPLFANRKAGRESAATLFEEDAETQIQMQPSRKLSRQSHLPTPRRSRGWWNLITSPFSAKSNGTFFRSPPPPDEEDRKRILEDASDMPKSDAMASHEGLIFLNRATGDDELRTALSPDTGMDKPSVLKRSDTAPAVLDTDVAQINIYNVPRSGLAAAYYMESKQFPSPSVITGNTSYLAKDFAAWSPSQSVADPEQDVSSALSQDRTPASGDQRVPVTSDMQTSETPVDKSTSPVNAKGTLTDSDPQASQSREKSPENIFSTLSEAELQDDTPVNTRPPLKERSEKQATQVTLTSAFSPLTETPIVEEAHSARLASAEPREIRLTPIPSETQLPRQRTLPSGLAQSTMASRGVNEPDAGYASEKGSLRPPFHRRDESSSSIGLGISDVECEKEPFPRVTRGLGTDRFGQLTIRDIDSDLPVRPWYKRFFWSLAFAATLLLLLLIVLIVAFVPPERHSKTAVQAEWLNLTGFPALPTGVSTVIQPQISREESRCVSPEKLWSCDMPAGSEGASSIPDFRFEIVFRNGTVPRNETQATKRAGGSTIAGTLAQRDDWKSYLYRSNPSPPSKEDQQLLGQYTDDLSAPFDGDETPFYLTLVDPKPLQSSTELRKRGGSPYPYPSNSQSNGTSHNSTTQSSKNIPKPLLQTNGKPAEAELYPFAEAQPLRLYNRGEADEHYGFYTYFARSMYVANVSGASEPLKSEPTSLENASAVCTWSQTRFHVQLWTRKGAVAELNDVIPLSGLPAAKSTANNLTAQGSFPYPVTVTLDRHGGDAKAKGVYCYGLDEEKIVVEDVKMWIAEDRGAGGSLLNPAAVPGGQDATTQKREEEKFGGVDGGSGGCACQWETHA
ncbi:hypothetical protein KC332_g673 [Hortaea werneckii]|uniref:Glycoprotease family protein n=2 Tax=Hortaea werneckii TaxID=91943 RepID=A0A3M7GV35_HORWE|nr:hypothetical protein KC358_g4634 [Hortaea werneckii]OTA37942.1 hypothetical protein BTJ68_02378 [Hortaea werneckii EXF-2000]KAI6850508.1 hypothetical protein KC350_g2106 [Hortaea werneckii]KAI6943345.1 hypothetical protein KC341_g1564 [Hortaea werneckii]KAI6949272.1 hypothetical protein KC348_g1434 [Hortaea werneckii]